MTPRPTAVLLAAAAGLGLFLIGALRHYAWNPSALCDFGAANLGPAGNAAYRASARSHFRTGFVLMEEGTGYDGQYYFFVACDPFALRTRGRWAKPYYWQRILHPFLAWGLAGGDPRLIPLTMALVTLGGILLGTWVLLKMAPACGWWSLAYAFAVGHLYGLQLSVGGPALSLGLSLAGLLAWEGRRMGFCILALALSLLARESALLVVGPLALWSFLQGRRRDALWVLMALLPWLAWEGYLYLKLGRWGLGVSGGHLTLPFLGILVRSTLITGSGVDFGASARGLVNNAVLLCFLGYAVWVAASSAALWTKERTLVGFLLLVHAAFFCCLTAGQLVDLNGASRPFLPVVPLLVLAWAKRPGWGGKLLLLAGLLFSLAVGIKVWLEGMPYRLWIP